MSSLFRGRRSEEEGRSGGKILRGRRAAPSSSPYLRPQQSPAPTSPPAVAQSGSPRWLLGLISGAGKLISSVLPSYGSSSPSSSSSYSSDEDVSSGFNEDDNGLPSRELHELNQRRKGSELICNCMDGSLAIVPKNDSKLTIERLLMQETFSRDECNKLTRLIQSRVVDFPSAEVCDGTQELQSRTTGSNIALPGASRSLNPNRKLPDTAPYSVCKLNAFSPESSAYEACTPDICNRAVMEAKKWLEEKKLASSSKYDPECGPCTLNTNMLQYGIEGEVGSPMDMAKSYMRLLPPWRSPSFSNVGFKTPPSSGMHLYKDGTSYATANHFLLSSKVLKRDHLDIGSWDTGDETRRVRLKSTDAMLEISKSKQIESCARLAEHESSKISSAADKRELYVEDHCSDGALRLPNEKAIEVNCPFKTGNINSVNIVSEPEETISVMQSTHGSPLLSTHPLEPAHNLDENQDVEGPSQTKEQVDSHDSLVLTSTLVEHDGNPLSELIVSPPDNIKSAAPSDADDVANLNDVHTSNIQTSSVVEGILQANNSSQLNRVSGLKETNCISDSRPDGDTQIPNEANGSIQNFTANGTSAEVKTNSDHETLSQGTNIVAGKSPQNGMRNESIEQVLTEPQPSMSRRRRKAVVKSRRGRS